MEVSRRRTVRSLPLATPPKTDRDDPILLSSFILPCSFTSLPHNSLVSLVGVLRL
jgi:hypothetical protein